jgi:hypothetical protein
MVYQHDLLDKLYSTIYALPSAQQQTKSCTTQDTQKHYYLFFEQDGVDVLSVEAYQGGKVRCERVTFTDGSVRQPDQQFWIPVQQALVLVCGAKWIRWPENWFHSKQATYCIDEFSNW